MIYFFPSLYYIQLFSVPLCENCQWRLRVWCQRLWRPNLQKCEEQAKSKAGQALLQEKKYTRRNRKSRKIVQFSSRERHLPSS